MKTLLTLLASHLLVICAYAQPFSNEFGKVPLNELTLTSCPIDKSADAFVIYDIGKSFFIYDSDKGFEVIFERKTKIKILKKSGFSWADIEIPVYQENTSYEDLYEIQATTYNIENGEITRTKLDPKAIYEEKSSQTWFNKKFAMPNIKEGSVIEISYKIKSPYLFNLRDWTFQRTIPTVYSEYNVSITPYYEYVYIVQGTSKFDVFTTSQESNGGNHPGSQNFDNMVYKFALKDVPAFKDEAYITSINDYIIQIDFQLAKIHRLDGSTSEIISTWPKMVSELLKNFDFGKYVNNAEKNAKTIINLAELSTKTKTEQLHEIVDFVKSNYKWNGSKSYFAEKTFKNFLKDKSGNSANINLLLAGLLKAAGIEAYPVIVSTRNHGKVATDYPFAHYFNYSIVMAKIDGKIILTDATDPMCPFNAIPPRCINDRGLIIKEGKDDVNWVLLSNSELSGIEKKITMNIKENSDTISCKLAVSATLYDAFDLKSDYENNTEKLEKKFMQNHFIQIDSLKTQNYEDPLKPYLVTFNAKYPSEYVDNKIYISPFLSEVMGVNPLKQANRIYPVDMIYPQRRVFSTTITIPVKYQIESLPKAQTIENDLFKMDYQAIKIDEKTIVVRGTYTTTKAVYTADEYAKIRFYFNELITKFNSKVVLIKAL
jgi:transglutaminase-like putative cysteine protease